MKNKYDLTKKKKKDKKYSTGKIIKEIEVIKHRKFERECVREKCPFMLTLELPK